MAALTYTQQVAAIRAELAAIEAKRVSDHAEVVAALAALKPAPAPPPVVEPPIDIPPVPPVVSEPPVPGSFAWTRSRSFNPPAIVRTAHDLIAARLVPPYDRGNVRGQQSRDVEATGIWPGMAYMGATGEREDIGIVPDDIARWLIGDDPQDMFVWAEGHAQVPVHFRIDGKMVDITEYPKATCFWSASAAGVNESDKFYFKSDPENPIKPEMAHYPNCCEVAYLATGDIYYLEELQDATTFMLINGNPGYRQYDKGLIREDQTRGYAWALNIIAAAYRATPENAPSSVLPKAYWKRILDNNRDEFRKWMSNPCHFAVDTAEGRIGPWQQDMLGAVMGRMVYTGQHDDWLENYEWHIRQAIDRTSGKSGYPRSRAVQYYYTKNAGSMAELASVNGLSETADGNFSDSDSRSAYGGYLRGNLKFAVLNGIPDAEECFAYVDGQVKTIPARWAV